MRIAQSRVRTYIWNREEETQSKSHAAADRALDTIIDYIGLQSLQAGLNLINRYRNRLNALEATLLADNSHENGASRSNNENLLGRGSTRTKREAKKRAARADAVKLNPELGDDLAAGEMGVEQLDAIASASDRTKGAAARDQTLIDDIKKGNADDAKRLADTYVDDHLTPEQHETRRQKQRRLRRLRRGFSDRGTETLTAEGDTETIDEMYKVLLTFADRLYHRMAAAIYPPANTPAPMDNVSATPATNWSPANTPQPTKKSTNPRTQPLAKAQKRLPALKPQPTQPVIAGIPQPASPRPVSSKRNCI